ncbi:MAG: SGNH/GDSL hydrolase family protein, partial [Planctomycetota bacterium]
MPSRRVFRALLASLGSLLLLDVGISLAAIRDGLFLGRPLPPFGATPHPHQRAWVASERARTEADPPPEGTGAFDAALGWTLRPGSRATGETIDALGARGPREYPRRKPEGTLRLLCYGDSFTFGAEVSDAEAWPALIEAARPGLEAINFGVGGYGTDQALLRFRRQGADLGADAVLIGFLLENVGRNVNRYRPLYYPATGVPGAKPRFRLLGEDLVLLPQPFPTREALARAVEDGSVLSLLAEGEHWSRANLPGPLRFSSLARLAAAYRAYSARQSRRLLLDEAGEPFRVTVALLETFHREALACGAREAPILVFPREEEMEALVGRDDLYWKGLLEALATRSIPFLDLSEPLAPAFRAAREDPDAPAVYRAGHLSPLGNRIAADAVLD